jgi:hypothetical protein
MNKGYEPMTITMRRALESSDINGDGLTNVNDMRYAINSNINGYANGFIICAAAPSTAGNDSLIGVIAEIAPTLPYITYRNTKDFDSIRGDNLYAANNMIKRNNAQQYCSRYNNTRQAINLKNGVNISSQDNWNIMKLNSTQSSNLQFMQAIPENGVFKISARTMVVPAYDFAPQIFNLPDLFNLNGINENRTITNSVVSVFPNPAVNTINLVAESNSEKISFEIIDLTGRVLRSSTFSSNSIVDISGFSSGVYLIKFHSEDFTVVKKFVKR